MGEVGVGSIGINIAVVGVAGLVIVSFGMCDVCIAGMGVAIGDLGGHVVGIHPPSIVRTWQHYSKKIKGHIPK
jgi:hypothetical protein